jgi:uncharacterized protein involved in exopolysaccharide biosynthesis
MDAIATPTDSDTRELLRRLAPRRWKILTSVLVCGGVATAAAFLMTPYYESKVVMVPAHNERNGGLKAALDQLGSLTALAGIDLKAGDEETQEAVGVLKSRLFTNEFIRDKNLTQKFFAKKWNPATKTWIGSPDKWPTPNKAFQYFDERVRTLVLDKKSGLITLNIVWKDRFEAAQWADELIKRLNAVMRARAIQRTDKNIAFLQNELKSGSYVEIRDAINHLIETQIRDRMVAAATDEFAFRVVDRRRRALRITGGSVAGAVWTAAFASRAHHLSTARLILHDKT